MNQFRRPFLSHLSVCLLFLFLLSICCFPSAPVVYALPGASVTGWVEVRCDPIPQDFSDTATVVFSNTETGEYYTVTCHKINDYIGRLELPAGKYQIEQTSTADNFAYEASTTLDSFEITAEMPAAQLITMSIVKHEVPYELPDIEVEESVPAPEPDGDSASSLENDPIVTSPVEDTEDTTDTSNSILDWLKKETASKDQTASENIADTQTEEGSERVSGGRAFMIMIGTILFIIIIMTLAYFARQHFEKE